MAGGPSVVGCDKAINAGEPDGQMGTRHNPCLAQIREPSLPQESNSQGLADARAIFQDTLDILGYATLKLSFTM